MVRRKRAGFTHKQLAAKTGVQLHWIRRYEFDRCLPPQPEWDSLRKFLKLPPKPILTFTQPEKPIDRPKIGEHLRRRRLELKLCLAEAAPRMGVSVPTLGLWELGKAFPKHCYHAQIGTGILTSKHVTLEREYSGKLWLTFATEERSAVHHILREAKIPADFKDLASRAATLADLDQLVEKLTKEGGEHNKAASATLTDAKEKLLGEATDLRAAALDAILKLVPQFFYFDEYSSLPGSIKIQELMTKQKDDLSEDESTARSLLELAGAESEYLLNADYEVRKRELENVANSITQDVLKYWTTNSELRVMIDIRQSS